MKKMNLKIMIKLSNDGARGIIEYYEKKEKKK